MADVEIEEYLRGEVIPAYYGNRIVYTRAVYGNYELKARVPGLCTVTMNLRHMYQACVQSGCLQYS